MKQKVGNNTVLTDAFDKFQIQINKLELDQNLLFIPVGVGLYIPLLINGSDLGNILDSNNLETSRLNSSILNAYQNVYLDLDEFSYKYKMLLEY